MNDVRIGYISSFDPGSGMASVYYPDRDPVNATSKMPVFAPFGIPQELEKDAVVLVLHLSNGSAAAVIMGVFTEEIRPQVSIRSTGTDIVLKTTMGEISVNEIIKIRDQEIPGLWNALGD